MKFSIITPTYNRSSTIERSIKSILNQTHKNFEMIIIDDGSSDDTAIVVKKYLNDSRIKYIGPNKNSGVNIARNIGFDNISPDVDWITFLDSDDEFKSDALANMKITIDKNSHYNYFRFAVIYDNGEEACYSKSNNIVLGYQETLKQEIVTGEWVCTIKKDIVDNGFRFNTNVKAFEALSWFDLSKKENCFYSLDIVRIYMRDVDGITRGATRSKDYYYNMINGHNLYLKYFGIDLKKYNKNRYMEILYTLLYLNIKMKEYTSAIMITYQIFKSGIISFFVFKKLIMKYSQPKMNK